MDILTRQGRDLSELKAYLSSAPADFVAIHTNFETLRAQGGALGHAVHGATSCLGAMTQEGATDGYAAFILRDPSGAYGTAMETFGSDAREAGASAARAALRSADRPGEVPELVWISATPGMEEAVLEGVQQIVGADTPVIGGSAADNDVSGNWCVFDGEAQQAAAVIVSVMFPSCPVSFAYQNGYAPSDNTGIVTKADGRSILEIDNRPAVEVYSEWTAGAVPVPGQGDGALPVLSESTMWPLGRKISSVGEVPFYLLAHPAVASDAGALDLFATVAEGEKLTAMTGTRRGLIDRAGRVAGLARATGGLAKEDTLGALMIYCGGCMLAVQDDLPDVVAGVNDALGGAPFLGAFTFGEQGPLLGAGNRHGNLMISCVVFG